MLRDPTDENVIPVVEELQRQLPQVGASHQQQGHGEEYNAEDGMLHYRWTIGDIISNLLTVSASMGNLSFYLHHLMLFVNEYQYIRIDSSQTFFLFYSLSHLNDLDYAM